MTVILDRSAARTVHWRSTDERGVTTEHTQTFDRPGYDNHHDAMGLVEELRIYDNTEVIGVRLVPVTG